MLSRIRSHVAAIFISCAAFLIAGPALADEAKASAPAAVDNADSGDNAAQAAKLLEKIRKGSTPDQRIEAASQLLALRPAPFDFYKKELERERESSDAERRAVLAKTNAEVPDENGRFATPQRETKKSEKQKDEYDWLADLSALSDSSELADVLVDVAIIHALAASENPEGGSILLDFAFSASGLIYRDECGRYLRLMSPYSLPALIRGSENRKSATMRRYAGYQLERLDRQNPHKAFEAAASESLQIAILNAFADSQYREAVYPVLDNVDHVAPRVRKAARAAWIEFVDGREPPKPPEKRLELPNGKLSREKAPLWLDHRVLAKTALLERLEALTGEKQNKKATLVELTEKLFSYYDHKRTQKHLAAFNEAAALAAAGETSEATDIFDRILANDPDFSKRADMVTAYLAQADALAKADKWREASVAYGKASAIAPEGEQAKAALKQHHLARAKVAESKGQDSSAENALAGEVGTETSAETSASDSKLTLFAGLAAFASALALLILGLAVRRRSSQP